MLELDRDGLAWMVGSDPEVLVATWKYDDARWRELLVAAGMATSITIKMYLDDHRSTVWSVDQEFRVGVSVENVGIIIGLGGFGGQRVEVGKNWTFGRTPDGRFGAASHTRFSENDIKRALQDVARDGGWAWKGVPFARLNEMTTKRNAGGDSIAATITADHFPPGITGFACSETPRHDYDAGAFKSSCYRVARASGRHVSNFEQQKYPRNYHAAMLIDETHETTVLCNAIYPVVAFAALGQPGFCSFDFIEDRDLAALFRNEIDVDVLSTAVLNGGFDHRSLSRLCEEERKAADFWKRNAVAVRAGDIIFNSWD